MLGVVLFNALAFFHIRAMLHYAPPGKRTGSPETLSAAGKLSVLLTGVRLPRPENFATPADHGLSFETHVLSDGGRELVSWRILHPEARGTVVLFHGYGTSKASLLPQARAYHQLGFTSVLVDFQGSGDSSGTTTTIGYREAEDVKDVIEALVEEGGPGPRILHGFSMGAAAILRAVADLDVPADGLVLEGAFDSMLSTVKNRFSAMGWPSFPAAETMLFWGSVQQGFSALRHRPSAYASRVRVPTLMLHGGEDRRTSPAQARLVFEHLAGPKAWFLFEKLGHVCLVQHDREGWLDAVQPFLDELSFSAANRDPALTLP